MYCILYYTIPSNYRFPDFSKKIDKDQLEKLESPVIRISVHLEKCKQMTYIGWELIIKSIYQIRKYSQYFRLRSEPQLMFVQINQMFILPPYAFSSHHTLYLHFLKLYLYQWWFMVSVQNLDTGIWKLRQQIPCEINRVFLDVLSKNGSQSELYRWSELSEEASTMTEFTTWITGCVRCIIIYVANNNLCCSIKEEVTLKLDIRKETGLYGSLSGSNEKIMQSQYTFYKYRYIDIIIIDTIM